MNFFERQAAAKKLSQRLIALFVLAVAAIVAAVDAVVVIALSIHERANVYGDRYSNYYPYVAPNHNGAIFLATIIVLSVIVIAALYKSSEFSAGGEAVAISMGGQRVDASTTDPLQKRLLNVVEEIAIASGVPVPQIFVLEQEPSINAFAAGSSPSNAAITVTRGALDTLERGELQGVIAHEFSHVLNGDMRLNTRLIGLLFGILVVALAGRFVLRLAPRGDRKGGGVAIAIVVGALAVMVIGYIGLFFGRLIQAAVARSRESLADASAVQFTRDPQGLRNALVKIGAIENGSLLTDVDAEEIAHLLFAPGNSRWFSTHPPLLDRIREIDPGFQPREFDAVRKKLIEQRSAHEGDKDISTPDAHRQLAQVAAQPIALGNMLLAGLVANPGAPQIKAAQLIRQSLPPDIIKADTDTTKAASLLLALALADDVDVQKQQVNFIATQLGAEIATQVPNWLPHIAALQPMQRQPALLRLLPTLRQLNSAERGRLLTCLNGLLLREGKVRVDKYALRKLAQLYLFESLQSPKHPGNLTLANVREELSVLFNVLAQFGASNTQQARLAYETGLQMLLPQSRPNYQQLNEWTQKMDAALKRLDDLLPSAKELLLAALQKTIASDGMVTINEAELLRTICAALHCPLPPIFAPIEQENI